MGLTSEHVHWLGGAAFTFVALALIAQQSRIWRRTWPSWLLPALLLGYGAESLADLWIHGDARPKGYGARPPSTGCKAASFL